MVTKVELLNRPDCCQDRLANVKIYIGDQLCGQTPSQTGEANWYRVTCKNGQVSGDKVRVYNGDPGNPLTLCGVKVMAVKVKNEVPKYTKTTGPCRRADGHSTFSLAHYEGKFSDVNQC